MNLSDIAISNIKGSKISKIILKIIISEISKIDAINLMQNTDLTEESGTL